VQQRDSATAAAVRARMQAQMSDDAKRHLADYVLDNNGDLQDLQRQVDTLVATLRQATR
jgi:dephospho-CoA kinase